METSKSRVSQWLQAAGNHTGLELSLGEDGHCRLLLDEDEQCVVEVPPDSELVFLYIAVARLPDDPPEACRALQVALELNAFGIETGGSSFSYDPRSEHIVLTYSARLDALDETLFCAVLDDFIQVSVSAKARFKQQVNEQGEVTSTQWPSATMPFLRA